MNDVVLSKPSQSFVCVLIAKLFQDALCEWHFFTLPENEIQTGIYE